MKSCVPIWFDIDGTLLHTTAGHGAFQDALKEVYGWEASMEKVVFAGNTDLQVLRDMSHIHVGDTESALMDQHAFFRRMAHYLDLGLHQSKPIMIAGADRFVRTLAGYPHVRLGLLTGNARECAFIKLRHIDLHETFSEGGFGDEHADRNVLAQQARKSLEEHISEGVTLSSGWVVGDTIRDVRAAQSIGALCLGVASGACSKEELKEAGATEVVDDLSQTEALIELLLS
jgi:phosphoglycolate phosphatase